MAGEAGKGMGVALQDTQDTGPWEPVKALSRAMGREVCRRH